MQTDSLETDTQQWLGRWIAMLNSLYNDPELNDRFVHQIARLMNTRIGQHLGRSPFLALALMLFVAMAALPVGLFLVFVLVTFIMSAVGFVFIAVFLLFSGGMTLLAVLSGLALFSVMVSSILKAFHLAISKIFMYYPKLTEVGKVREAEGCSEASKKEVK